MTLVPFLPKPGLDSDNTTFAAGLRWATGNNVRTHLGRAQPIGGIEAQFTLPLTGACADMLAFTRSGVATIAYSQGDKISVGTNLNSPSDRSPAASGLGTGYSFAAWGNATTTLLAAQYTGTLYEQSGAGAATAVAEAPDRIDAGIIVTPERQVLAFGCNEVGGTHNPMCIRCSDFEDYSSAGSWTPTATNNSDEVILDGLGAIILARQVGPYVAVLTTTALYLGEFRGDPGQTYHFGKVAEGCGPLTKRTASVFGGRLWWMGRDYQLRTWAPGELPAIIPSPISRELAANSVHSPQPAFTVANSAWEEIWFFYYDTRDTELGDATRYVAYSIRESAMAQSPVWFTGQMERVAMIDSEIIRDASGNDNSSLLGVNAARSVILHDLSFGFLTASIRSAGFYIDESGRRVMIRGIIPDFEDQSGNVTLNLYIRDRPNSSAGTDGPHTLSTSTEKLDIMASGKIIEVELSSSSVKWRLGKPLFDVAPMGER